MNKLLLCQSVGVVFVLGLKIRVSVVRFRPGHHEINVLDVCEQTVAWNILGELEKYSSAPIE